MARSYSVIFSEVAVTALQDFFELNVGANNPCQLTGLHLAQRTDAGDAEDEQLAIIIIRGETTSGSGGSSPTPIPLDNGDTAAAASAEVNNTTVDNTPPPVDSSSGSNETESASSNTEDMDAVDYFQKLADETGN